MPGIFIRLKEILEMRQEDLSHTLQQEIDGVPEGNEAVAIAVSYQYILLTHQNFCVCIYAYICVCIPQNIKYQREEKKLHSLYSTAQLELKE